MNYYQITYDHTQYYQPDAIHSVMTTIPGATEWWHFLPNVYLVETTTATEQDIANHVGAIFTGLRFFIAKIDINATNGVLPKSAWDWINRKNSVQKLIQLISTGQNTQTNQARVGLRSQLLEDILNTTKK